MYVDRPPSSLWWPYAISRQMRLWALQGNSQEIFTERKMHGTKNAFAQWHLKGWGTCSSSPLASRYSTSVSEQCTIAESCYREKITHGNLWYQQRRTRITPSFYSSLRFKKNCTIKVVMSLERTKTGTKEWRRHKNARARLMISSDIIRRYYSNEKLHSQSCHSVRITRKIYTIKVVMWLDWTRR